MKFDLADICEMSDVVLVDACIMDKNERLLEEVYDCGDFLNFDVNKLGAEIEFNFSLFNTCKSKDNLFTVQGVVEEKKKHLDLLNKLANFHRMRLKSLSKNRSMRITRKKDKRHEDYEEDEFDREYEQGLIREIGNYSGSLFNWTDYLDDKIIPIEDHALFEAVSKEVASHRLKIDFSFRYRNYKKKGNSGNDSITDEALVFVAYEQSLKGKNVSIVSNDSDLIRILSFGFGASYFRLPKKTHISLYSRFREEKYTLKFDTIFPLCNPTRVHRTIFNYLDYKKGKIPYCSFNSQQQ